ncbi:MAG: copper resistance protein CopC [Mesorhizobium sp.]|nr:copper resistance protein CopC [Mesorhizobium sp.]
MSTRLRAFLLVLLMALAVAPRPALAHAVLLGTEPHADEVLDATPASIQLRFNEPVQPVVFRLLDAAGNTLVDTDAARAVDQRVELPTGGDLPEGGYIVTWRVVSADSHPIGGSFRFAVGALPEAWWGEAMPAAQQDARGWIAAAASIRAIFLAALLTATGGAWFALLVARDQAQVAGFTSRLVRVAAITGGVAALVGIGLQGGLLLAAAPLDLLAPSLWTASLATPVGGALLASAVMLFILAAICRPVPGQAAAIVALLAILPLGMAGHAATSEPRLLTAPSVMLHAVVAGFWVGSLPPLLFAVRRLPAGEAARLLERFSGRAVMAVILLVSAGTILAALQLRDVAALWQTSYGLVLAAKLVLVSGLMLIAIQNKEALTYRLAAGDVSAARRLRRNIGIEIGLVGGVVVLTALLGFNTPPRGLAAVPAHVHDDMHEHSHDHEHDHAEPSAVEHKATVRGTTAILLLSPARAGRNTLTVSLRGEDGNSIEPLEVEARLASADLGIEATTRRLERGEEGYALETSDMAIPGTWQIRIDALVTDFDKPIFTFEVEIGSP